MATRASPIRISCESALCDVCMQRARLFPCLFIRKSGWRVAVGWGGAFGHFRKIIFSWATYKNDDKCRCLLFLPKWVEAWACRMNTTWASEIWNSQDGALQFTLFWHIEPFKVVDVYKRFGGTWYLHLRGGIRQRQQVLRNFGTSTRQQGVTLQKTDKFIVSNVVPAGYKINARIRLIYQTTRHCIHCMKMYNKKTTWYLYWVNLDPVGVTLTTRLHGIPACTGPCTFRSTKYSASATNPIQFLVRILFDNNFIMNTTFNTGCWISSKMADLFDCL